MLEIKSQDNNGHFSMAYTLALKKKKVLYHSKVYTVVDQNVWLTKVTKLRSLRAEWPTSSRAGLPSNTPRQHGKPQLRKEDGDML